MNNKTHFTTSDSFAQMQQSKLFFELNFLNNPEYGGYDMLTNIDTKESIQFCRLSDLHYSYSERQKMAIEIVGMNFLKVYFPLTSKADLLQKAEDEHLNGKYQRTNRSEGLIYDNTHFAWMNLHRNKSISEKLRKLGIINSYSCWTSIVKYAMMQYYDVTKAEILEHLESKKRLQNQ